LAAANWHAWKRIKKRKEATMSARNPVKIIGSGIYLPQSISSEIIEEKFGIPSGWAEKYSGVKSRHHVTFESNGYMAARAIEKALADSNLSIRDLDLIISAGATFDFPLPNQSSVVKNELEDKLLSSVGTIDVDTTCLSFISAFEISAKLLDGKQYKNIAIVSSEIASKGLNSKNFETLTLFGDGAAAFILSYDKSGESKFVKGGLRTYSEGVFHTVIRGGGNKYFFKDHPYDEDLHSFDMQGKKLLRLAKQKGPEFVKWFFEDLQIPMSEIEVVIPHQASKVGMGIFKNSLPFAKEKIKENIETHGNCIAASIPILLHQTICAGELRRGEYCMLVGTSAGFSIGGLVFKY